MALPFLATLRDLIEHTLDATDALSLESQQRRVRVAIQTAYRDLFQAHEWKYYKQHARIQLYAPYTTGTVAYTASTRIVTLTGGTWPTWARYAHIRFSGNSVVYKVSERDSGTQVTLEPGFAPTANVVALTKYTLFRSKYPLPGDCLNVTPLQDESTSRSRGYVSPEEWLRLERHIRGTSTPFAWTIMGSPELYGQLEIALHGYPASNQTVDFIMRRAARNMRLDGYTRYSSMSGSLVSSIVGTTVTLSTAVEPDVVGAVFRASVNGAAVEPEGEHSPNAYLWQTTIYDRPTTTTLTLYDTAPSGYTAGTRFTISDPVDVAPYMYNALLKSVEYELLAKTDPSRANAFLPVKIRALKEAMERDHVGPPPESPGAARHYAENLISATIVPTPTS